MVQNAAVDVERSAASLSVWIYFLQQQRRRCILSRLRGCHKILIVHQQSFNCVRRGFWCMKFEMFMFILCVCGALNKCALPQHCDSSGTGRNINYTNIRLSFSFTEEEWGLKATHSYTHSLQADCDCIHARCTVTAALFVSSQQIFLFAVVSPLAAALCLFCHHYGFL